MKIAAISQCFCKPLTTMVIFYIGLKRSVKSRALAFTENLEFTYWKFQEVNSERIKLYLWNRQVKTHLQGDRVFLN